MTHQLVYGVCRSLEWMLFAAICGCSAWLFYAATLVPA